MASMAGRFASGSPQRRAALPLRNFAAKSLHILH
jgi:hypothetical protein